MSSEMLTRDQVGLAYGELDMYLKELTSHAANKERHVSLRISEIARKSHFAALAALDAALAELRLADLRILALDRAVETALYHPLTGREVRDSINGVLDALMPEGPPYEDGANRTIAVTVDATT